jgi:hypothetical protein
MPVTIFRQQGDLMAEAPPPSDIPNVFGMNQPQHMVTKLYAEIQQLTESLSVWTKSESFPTPLFIAWNAAVTAWHLTDWLWASNQDTRVLLSKKYGFNYDEATDNGREKGLQKFQKIVREKCRELHVCEEIANASKHMRRRTNDPDIRAAIEWLEAPKDVGHVKKGDLVMDLVIHDKETKTDAQLIFIEAAGYWENLLREQNLIGADAVLAQKTIPANH